MVDKEILEYFSGLLNKPVDGSAFLALSSAQRVRVYAWLTERNIIFNEDLLNQQFTVNELINKTLPLVDLGALNLNPTSHESKVNFSSSLNVGIDIQEVKELFPHKLPPDPKSDAELLKIFTLNELSYAQSKHDPEVTLTGIFSAKEAIQKASNIKLILGDIEVLPDENGRPFHKGYALSISHSGGYAIAMAHQVVNHHMRKLEEGIEFDLKPKNPLSVFSSLRVLDFIYIFVLLFFAYLILNPSL